MLWVLSTAFASGVVHVPADFASLQDAIDQSDAGVIVLDKGRHAGAVVDRPVEIHSAGGVIDQGVSVGGLSAGIWLRSGAAGSVIDGVSVDCDGQVDAGVYSSYRKGGLAQNVVVSDVKMRNCVQGISILGAPRGASAAGWMVSGLRVDGTRSDSLQGGNGGGIGVMAYNVSDVELVDSAFTGWSDDAANFATAGVVLSGCARCSVVGNRFATEGSQWGHASIVDAGATIRGGRKSVDLVIADNDARDGAWYGVDVRIHGTDGLLAEGNAADFWVAE